jgi:hypothetical protein
MAAFAGVMVKITVMVASLHKQERVSPTLARVLSHNHYAIHPKGCRTNRHDVQARQSVREHRGGLMDKLNTHQAAQPISASVSSP